MSPDQLPVEIRRIRADEGLRLRALRLRALAEAPLAFGSTLAREQAFTESVWDERAAGAAAGSARATFVAEVQGQWVGLATGVARHPDDLDHSPILVGMFVDAPQRGRGVGVALIERVTGWVRTLPAECLYSGPPPPIGPRLPCMRSPDSSAPWRPGPGTYAVSIRGPDGGPPATVARAGGRDGIVLRPAGLIDVQSGD
jgi:GNAT superfamily N-acetyltransferase